MKERERQPQQIPESAWEARWRTHEQSYMGRPKTDMPAVTPEQEAQIHAAYENLPAELQQYVSATEKLRDPELTPDDRRMYEKEQQTRIVKVIRDEKLAQSLSIYTSRVYTIRMGTNDTNSEGRLQSE